jgi:hypothetical protein
MRLFELITFGQAYLRHFDRNVAPKAAGSSYAALLAALLDDRHGNAHVLEPILAGAESARLVVADSSTLQDAWRAENGVPRDFDAADVVLAQIEEHRSEIFYNISPLLYDTRFVRRLPGCVKHTICWRAAPIGHADLSGYELSVGNFQSMIDEWTRLGRKAAWFEPAHDPVAAEIARGRARDIDVAFVGTYSWLHGRRNLLLQRIAELAPALRVRFHFSLGRSARVANALGPARALFPKLALPDSLRRVSHAPVYGRGMYELFGRSRIVINAAIDMASEFRGNMRCWEAMGCGALMLSDNGIYPPGMTPGADFATYDGIDDAVANIERIVADYDRWRPTAAHGLATMEQTYSKEAQWATFVKLVEQL